MGKYICGPDKKYSKYDLFGVSQHFGGTGGGHYTAICKNYDGNCYDYNDSSCPLSSSSNVVSSSAYVLFYRKQNW
jgi:ubiquitin carboxyl-terminal hydrolase 4/11/15